MNDHEKLKLEKQSLCSVPAVRAIGNAEVSTCYKQIKKNIADIVDDLMSEILKDPEKEYLIVKK